MIQDIYPYQMRNEFIPGTLPVADSIILHFIGNEVLTKSDKEEENLIFPRWRELTKEPKQLTYLFRIDQTLFFLILDQEPVSLPGYEYEAITMLRKSRKVPQWLSFAGFTANHLSHWYQSNRFCGSCGHPTQLAEDERAIDCPVCHIRRYPRIQPAVIVGVINGDSLLITRYANRITSIPALIAGFTEIGETLEETVAREVMEETGLRVKNIRYYKSQPWGIVDDLLAGFYCDVEGDDTIRIDKNELKEALWVRREEIEGQPDHFSLTNEMMLRFRAGEHC
ncbi:MAG: NAD(+) diphosphatase [Blautia sp.]|nr:NAD(+) diphosphatase [Blautia sp.]